MPKKTIVTSILQSGVPSFAASYFRVGTVPINAGGVPCTAPGDADTPAFPPVTEIISCRDRFGGGAQIDQPCYMITFEDSPEKVVIPATMACQVTVAVIDPEAVNIPNMPQ